MSTPSLSKLSGVHRDKVRNRFEWDFDKIPSPQRSRCFPSTTEHVPVLCKWCNTPYWPAMDIMEGCCTDACEQHYACYLRAVEDRDAALDALGESTIDTASFQALLGRVTIV